MNINILEYCDGFDLVAHNSEGVMIADVHIDQEDSVEKLAGFFEQIGIKSSHEECY